MEGKAHDWQGTLEIIDDCSFRVTGFKYDGKGPAAYWYAGASTSQSDLTEGFRLSEFQIQGAPNGGETIEVQLTAGLTWDKVGAISGWCETFNADFGSGRMTSGSRCHCKGLGPL